MLESYLILSFIDKIGSKALSVGCRQSDKDPLGNPHITCNLETENLANRKNYFKFSEKRLTV